MVHPRYRVVRGRGAAADGADAGLSDDRRPRRRRCCASWSTRRSTRADLADTLPEALRAALRPRAVRGRRAPLHRPPPDADAGALEARTHPAWRRMKFDELLAQQLSMRLHYRARRRADARAAARAARRRSRRGSSAQLPFRLTRAQVRVVDEIARDLAQPHPMQRLLQGDVGSGKTIVAALAALRAVENGYQAAVMAPTEILAEQHYRKFADWLAPLGVRVAWLARRLPARASGGARSRRSPRARRRSRSARTRCSRTKVEFARLGARHRRRAAPLRRAAAPGAAQARASAASAVQPHQLMMSATPIPRTLAMSYYADLDVSVIDELPPGRTPVVTKLVAGSAARRGGARACATPAREGARPTGCAR